MGVLRRCKTESEARGSAGGGGESARCDNDIPRACRPERRNNAEKGSSNRYRDDRPVEPLQGALADESETAGGAVN